MTFSMNNIYMATEIYILNKALLFTLFSYRFSIIDILYRLCEDDQNNYFK